MKIDPNHVPEGAVALRVSDGTWTLVDADVAEALAGVPLYQFGNGSYVGLRAPGGLRIYLHHIVAGIVPGKEIHHRNHCRRDNRRENLRHLPCADHRRLHGRAVSSSGFLGVAYHGRGRYRPVVMKVGRQLRGPTFREPLLAAMARDDLVSQRRLIAARNFDSTISPGHLLALLEATAGRFFTLWFVKRSNGELRRMNCRLRKKADSPGLKFDPRAAGLLPVWDTAPREYRFINLEGVLCLRMNGKSYRIERRRALAA